MTDHSSYPIKWNVQNGNGVHDPFTNVLFREFEIRDMLSYTPTKVPRAYSAGEECLGQVLHAWDLAELVEKFSRRQARKRPNRQKYDGLSSNVILEGSKAKTRIPTRG